MKGKGYRNSGPPKGCKDKREMELTEPKDHEERPSFGICGHGWVCYCEGQSIRKGRGRE